jgi:hypothetical protein
MRTRPRQGADVPNPTDFREMIVHGQVSFADLAARESDCSSASKGGDLGQFGRGQMQSALPVVFSR